MKFDVELAVLQMRTTASILTDPLGGPIRTIINGRHHKPTGRYSSCKARRALPWEDKREREYFWHCEADANVVSYLSQPHRLEIDAGLRTPLIYFPDVRRDMADGTVQIREIKKIYNREDDPAYDLKLKLARQVYEGLGWSFDIVQAYEIEARQTLATVRFIQFHRHVRVTTADKFLLLNLFERSGGTAPFQHIVEVLGGGVAGEARLCACIVRRILAVNIAAPLGPDSQISLAPHTSTLAPKV
jgi:hypothetical protein